MKSEATTKEGMLGQRLGRFFTYIGGHEAELKEHIEKLDKDLQRWTMMYDAQKELNIVEFEEYIDGDDLLEYETIMNAVNSYDDSDLCIDFVDGYLLGRNLRRTIKPTW